MMPSPIWFAQGLDPQGSFSVCRGTRGQASAFPNHRNWRPEEWVGHLRRQLPTCLVDECELGLTQRPCHTKVRVFLHPPQGVRYQESRYLVADRPVGHSQRSRSSIEESTREA